MSDSEQWTDSEEYSASENSMASSVWTEPYSPGSMILESDMEISNQFEETTNDYESENSDDNYTPDDGDGSDSERSFPRTIIESSQSDRFEDLSQSYEGSEHSFDETSNHSEVSAPASSDMSGEESMRISPESSQDSNMSMDSNGSLSMIINMSNGSMADTTSVSDASQSSMLRRVGLRSDNMGDSDDSFHDETSNHSQIEVGQPRSPVSSIHQEHNVHRRNISRDEIRRNFFDLGEDIFEEDTDDMLSRIGIGIPRQERVFRHFSDLREDIFEIDTDDEFSRIEIDRPHQELPFPDIEPAVPCTETCDHGTCPICTEKVFHREPTITPCGHIFCKNCLLNAISQRTQCPMCRKNVQAKETFRVHM